MIKNKIGLITCHPDTFAGYFPTQAEPDWVVTEPGIIPDDQLLVDRLRKDGFQVDPLIWNHADTPFHDYPILLMRTPWDYSGQFSAFKAWLHNLSHLNCSIFNPPDIMLWLLDKSYLATLEKWGIPVIPSQYLSSGSIIDLPAHYAKHGALVFKPRIAAGGKGLFEIQSAEDAKKQHQALNQALAVKDYLCQPLISDIRTNGEWSLIFINGQYSHAVHKTAPEHTIMVHAERGGGLNLSAQPSPPLIKWATDCYAIIAHHVQSTFPTPRAASSLLYLRLDFIETNQGVLLIECEGVEPELFFRVKPDAVKLFSHALQQFLEAVTLR